MVTRSLPPFCLAYRYFAAFKVDVFHSKSYRFHKAQPGAEEQAGNQIVGSLESSQDCLHFATRKNHGNFLGRLGAFNVVYVWQVALEHFPIKKE